jgi:hypothetical protein
MSVPKSFDETKDTANKKSTKFRKGRAYLWDGLTHKQLISDKAVRVGDMYILSDESNTELSSKKILERLFERDFDSNDYIGCIGYDRDNNIKFPLLINLEMSKTNGINNLDKYFDEDVIDTLIKKKTYYVAVYLEMVRLSELTELDPNISEFLHERGCFIVESMVEEPADYDEEIYR